MFESDLLESFSHVHPITPLVLFVPLVAFMLWLTWQRSIGMVQSAGLFLVGVVLWTLTEYAMHRFVFHWQPDTKWGRRLHFIFHGVHHDYPNDGTRLVLPPSVSVPLAIAFWFLWKLVFGQWAPPAFAGLLVGYLFYDMTHYAVHHLPIRSRIGRKLKKHHMKHHYREENRAYGVSSPFWDYVFRTMPK